MKVRIWCKKHKKWHGQHANYHCVNGKCTPKRENNLVSMVSKDGKRFDVRAPHCPLWDVQ